MKIEKIFTFNEEDKKALQHFKTEIFDPICKLVDNHCELCPFNNIGCGDLGDLLDELCEKDKWVIPTRGE